MAISDIGRSMAMYAQPSQFDQNAWKTAFDIANAFTKTQDNNVTLQDNQRKLRENLATEQNRVANLNQQFQTQTAQNRNIQTQQQGLSEGWDFLRNNAVDPETERVRTPEQLFTLARQINPSINPVAFANLLRGYQQYAGSQAAAVGAENPILASTYQYLAGLGDNRIGDNGTLTDFNTGEVVGQLSPQAIGNFIQVQNGNIGNGVALGRAGGSGNAGMSQTNWQSRFDIQQQAKQQAEENKLRRDAQQTMQKAVQEAIKDISSEGVMDQQQFNQRISNLNSIYSGNPYALEALRQITNSIAERQGWNLNQTRDAQGVIGTDYSLSPIGTGTTQTAPMTPQTMPTQTQIATEQLQAQASAQPQPVIVQPQPLDYRNIYNLSEQDLAQVAQLQNIAGIDEQTAMKQLQGFWTSRQLGTRSNEQTAQEIADHIQATARRLQAQNSSQQLLNDLRAGKLDYLPAIPQTTPQRPTGQVLPGLYGVR